MPPQLREELQAYFLPTYETVEAITGRSLRGGEGESNGP
jgi:hypothetical protein